MLIDRSPRWLVSKDRHEEALDILIKYHAEGDASAELPHVELAEIQAALKIENESRARGWGELFQTKGMRHRSLVAGALGLFVQFSGNVSAFLAGSSTARQQQQSHCSAQSEFHRDPWIRF